MERWQQLLRDGDPVSRDPSLTSEDVDRIRRSMLNTEPGPARLTWLPRMAVASAVTAALVAAVWIGRSVGGPRPDADSYTAGAIQPDPGRSNGSHSAAERRQVQFATPGGTRVIWVF